MKLKFTFGERLRQAPDPHLIHLSEFFVIVLIGVSFEATIEPIGEAMRKGQLHAATVLLLGTFVMTTFRFLVGNYRHLNNEKIRKGPRFVLLFDMFWIGVESLVMIFLGGFTSAARNHEALEAGHRFNYLTLLIALALIDLVWILARQVLFRVTKVDPALRGFQWDWCLLNVALIAPGAVVLCGAYEAFILSGRFLAAVFAVNLCVFVIDVFGFFDFSPKAAVDPTED